MSTGKVSFKFDTTLFCKSNASPLLLLSIVLGYYVVAINGSHPMIRWEMERGLDMTISSVAGESYTVDVSSVETLFFLTMYDVHI